MHLPRWVALEEDEQTKGKRVDHGEYFTSRELICGA